jgi:hypothetical protein
MEVCKTLYGLKDAGALSKAKLDKILLAAGYSENKIVPCLYKHATNGVSFVLVVDDFAVKYLKDDSLNHLVNTLKDAGYELSVDLKASKFCGLDIKYNKREGWIEISCKGYVDKVLHRFRHRKFKKESSPMVYVTPNFGEKIQMAKDDPADTMSPAAILEAQQIIGCVLWYSRMVDAPTLTAVTKCASQLGEARISLEPKLDRLLGHLAAFPNNCVRYYASDMVFRTFSDASYLSETKSRSRAGAYGYFGWTNDPHRLNGPVLIDSTVLDVVVSSVAEAEYGAAYRAGRHTVWFRIIAAALGFQQDGPTIVYVDNTTAVGLANNTLKIARTKAIDMRFHWLRDRVRQGQLKVLHIPGAQQLADFFTKPLAVKDHLSMMTRFVRTPQRAHFNPRQ